MAKLIAGSCPQLVFQAVLLGGYTEFSSEDNFPWSQVLSILCSVLMIAKTTAEIVNYNRPSPVDSSVENNTVNKWLTISDNLKEYKVKETEEVASPTEGFLKETWWQLVSSLPLRPFVLSSLIFNTGTLVLTIIVTEWYSAIYIGIVLLLNLTISFIFPYSTAQKAEEKLGVEYKFPSPDEAEKVKRTRVVRGIFASWANLFVFLRPVENMSYHKIVHVSLLQPLRFLVNIVTLVIVCQITWTTHKHSYNQQISLVLTFAIVLVAGILNMVMFRYFYKKKRMIKPSRPENVPEGEEDLTTMSFTPPLLHSTSERVQLEGALKEEKSPPLSIAEGAIEQAEKT